MSKIPFERNSKKSKSKQGSRNASLLNCNTDTTKTTSNCSSIGFNFQGESLVGISATDAEIKRLKQACRNGNLAGYLSNLNRLGRYKEIIVRDLPGILGGHE